MNPETVSPKVSPFAGKRAVDNAHLRSLLYDRLEEAGELIKIKEFIAVRLKECGWEEQVRANCKETIADVGVENITVDGLIEKVTGLARVSVPHAVKMEVVELLKQLIEKHAGDLLLSQ